MIGIALVSSISYAAGRAALRGGATHAGRTRLIQSVAAAPVSSVLAAEPATHPGFELVKVEMVDEYTIKCATYRHIKSGAELISAQADDDNKVFGIVFRTPVTDSPDTQTHRAPAPMQTLAPRPRPSPSRRPLTLTGDRLDGRAAHLGAQRAVWQRQVYLQGALRRATQGLAPDLPQRLHLP